MTSPVFHFKEIAGRLRDVLFRHEDATLKELLPKTGNDELAHLIDSVPVREKRRVFRALPPDRRSHIVVKLSGYSQEAVLRPLGLGELRAMIDTVESDRAVDVIQLLDVDARDKVIIDLKRNDPKGILALLVFDEETAGGRMKTELLRVSARTTVEEVRRSLAAPGKLKSHQLYVVDENDALVGTLAPLKLLQAPPSSPLSEIMNAQFFALPAAMDQEEVSRKFDEQNALELPVVNQKGKLLGVITADDIFEVMEQEYAEDVSRMVGIDEDAHITDPAFVSVRRRLPWLTVNLLTASAAGSVVGAFQDTIGRIVLLAAFMPIIAGMGGNAAQQTLGVTVRAIAFGHFRHVNTLRVIGKEVAVGAMNGLLLGVVMGGAAYFLTHEIRLGAVILAAMTANFLMAGLVGVAVPATMKALRVDPALASTVFVTAATDICGFLFLLGLATALL